MFWGNQIHSVFFTGGVVRELEKIGRDQIVKKLSCGENLKLGSGFHALRTVALVAL